MSVDRRASYQTAVKGHFATIASRYRSLRSTDDEPVLRIRDRLPVRALTGLDVGAGTGRYTDLIRNVVAPGSVVIGADLSEQMLRRLVRVNGTAGAAVLNCESESLPMRDQSIDFVTTFNAVHHFDLARFADEATRVLVPNGDLFVYTRTREQNAQSIWGRLFPEFAARETRLFDEATLERVLGRVGTVEMTSFCFSRHATPTRLAEQVRNRSYSTFSLYEPEELERALARFLDGMDDSEEVHWQDRNLLVCVHRSE